MNTHYRVHITLYMKIPHTSNTSMAQSKGGTATRDSGTSRFGSAFVGWESGFGHGRIVIAAIVMMALLLYSYMVYYHNYGLSLYLYYI